MKIKYKRNMNRLVHFRRFAASLAATLISLFALSGCIMEDLDDCPPPPPPPAETGKVWLNFSFTLHNQKEEGGTYKDLFARYARSAEVFIFDADGRFVMQLTDTEGLFVEGYRMPVELDPGQYRAVTWVNLCTESALQLLPAPQAGVTTIGELRVQLRNLSQGTMSGQLLPLFYGDTTPFTIEKATGYDQDIDIPCGLVRNTNRVHVAIAWRDKETKRICPHWAHADSVRIYIDDANATLGFDNLLASGDSITYIPTYLTGNQAQPAAQAQAGGTDTAAPAAAGDSAVLHAELDMLRLLTASTPRLRICRLQADGTERTVYEKCLMKDFIAHICPTQDALDREDYFRIDLEFECEHIADPGPDEPDPEDPDKPDPEEPDEPGPGPGPGPGPRPDPDPQSWIAVSVSINGWILVDNGDIDL